MNIFLCLRAKKLSKKNLHDIFKILSTNQM